jgi:hypothetical protein
LIERLRDTLRHAGLNPQTANKVLTIATAIFKLAVRRNYWTSNPAANAERLRLTTAELAEDGSRPVRDGSRPVRAEEVLSPGELQRFARGRRARLVSDSLSDRIPYRDAS